MSTTTHVNVGLDAATHATIVTFLGDKLLLPFPSDPIVRAYVRFTHPGVPKIDAYLTPEEAADVAATLHMEVAMLLNGLEQFFAKNDRPGEQAQFWTMIGNFAIAIAAIENALEKSNPD